MIAPAVKQILIVEDEEATAMEMSKALERMGYKVAGIFTSGEEFLKKADRAPYPDLVIMDVALAGSMDGIQAGKYAENHMNLPVIYITGYREKAVMLEGKGRVPLLKPFTTDELRAAVGVVFYRISLRNAQDPSAERKIPDPQKPDMNLNG